MEVKITTFHNPFSFFCLPESNACTKNVQDILPDINNNGSPLVNRDLTKAVTHGQYVAVLWNNQWVRGIVTMENQIQIWLVDYGIYLRANDKTVFVNLPAEDKKYPTKVFEASIHGCIPLDKVQTWICESCEFVDKPSTSWSYGATQKAQDLIAQATKTYFVPIAIMATKANDIVLGDIYFKIKDRGLVSLVDELENWPVLLKRDPQMYIENMSKFYTSRRQHRASPKKPAMSEDLPIVTPELKLNDYITICERSPILEPSECGDSDQEGSTLTYLETSRNDHAFKPTAEEVERYSNIYIAVAGHTYNVLNVLVNKARDLNMCEKYADQKYIGRANSRSRPNDDLDELL